MVRSVICCGSASVGPFGGFGGLGGLGGAPGGVGGAGGLGGNFGAAQPIARNKTAIATPHNFFTFFISNHF
ncbi:hypothetical protein [Chitinophaga lutea]|uniref:hypothetical protein n=1 Tax=Chitinophaga lutea TaxID=2488634 RepID=UPI001315140B|nr:hypothetical protein [Chitinophaga lutea]